MPLSTTSQQPVLPAAPADVVTLVTAQVRDELRRSYVENGAADDHPLWNLLTLDADLRELAVRGMQAVVDALCEAQFRRNDQHLED